MRFAVEFRDIRDKLKSK